MHEVQTPEFEILKVEDPKKTGVPPALQPETCFDNFF